MGHPVELVPLGVLRAKKFGGSFKYSKDEATLLRAIDEVVTAVWREVNWNRGETVYRHADRVKSTVDRVMADIYQKPTKFEVDLLYLEGISAFLGANQVAGRSTTERGFIDMAPFFGSEFEEGYKSGFPKQTLEEFSGNVARGRQANIKSLDMSFADMRLEAACGDSALTTVVMADHLGVYSREVSGIARATPWETQEVPTDQASSARATYQHNHAWSFHLIGLPVKKGPHDVNFYGGNWGREGVEVLTDPFWVQVDKKRLPKRKVGWHFVCARTPAMQEIFKLTHIENMSSTADWLRQDLAPWNSKRYLNEAELFRIPVERLRANFEASQEYDMASGR